MSGIFMQSTELSNDQMADVMQWAYNQDPPLITVTTSSVRNVESNQELLDLDDSDCRITWNVTTEQFELKAAKGSGYPCVEVKWYGSAAYCNYRSQMEGLAPCYDLFYEERYQERYGFWRPTCPPKPRRRRVIGTTLRKFLECGDLKHGFARVRCPKCREEFFVPFSVSLRQECVTGDGVVGRVDAICNAHRQSPPQPLPIHSLS